MLQPNRLDDHGSGFGTGVARDDQRGIVQPIGECGEFNGEQDVYFLRNGDCNENGIHDSSDIADGTCSDHNGNTVPDECERGDFDTDGDVDLADFAEFQTTFDLAAARPSG